MSIMASNVYDFSFELKKNLQKKITFIILLVCTFFLVFTLIFNFLLFPSRIQSDAMSPQMTENSFVYVYRTDLTGRFFWQLKNVSRGDVVYIQPQQVEKISFYKRFINLVTKFFTFQLYSAYSPENEFSGSPSFGRVVGLPGDTIYMKNYILYIKPADSSHFLTEFELAKKGYEIELSEQVSHDLGIGIAGVMDEIVLGDDEYFVLADNRISHLDSRFYGPVNEQYIKGKVLFRYFPLTRLPLLNRNRNAE